MRKKNEITRKLALILCAVLAAGAIMTGCGGSASSTAVEEEATEAVSEAVEEEAPVVEETATTEVAAVSATAAEGATISAINEEAFSGVFNAGAIADVTAAEEDTVEVEAKEISEDTLNAASTMTKGDVFQDNPNVAVPKLTPPFTTPEQSLIYLIDYIRGSAYTQDVYVYYGYENGIDLFVLCSLGGKKIGVDTIYESDLKDARLFGVMRSSGTIASSDEYGNTVIEKY